MRVPRRGFEFVTRKITSHVARIKLGQIKELRLGNLDAKRDWGHAPELCPRDVAHAPARPPDDYVISTGETHTVREFLEIAFGHVGLDYNEHVVIDQQLYRPAEVSLLLGDCTKARRSSTGATIFRSKIWSARWWMPISRTRVKPRAKDRLLMR